MLEIAKEFSFSIESQVFSLRGLGDGAQARDATFAACLGRQQNAAGGCSSCALSISWRNAEGTRLWASSSRFLPAARYDLLAGCLVIGFLKEKIFLKPHEWLKELA